METIIWLMLLATIGYVVWKFWWPKADVNKDGKVDTADVTATVEKAVTVLDVNKDGKIDTVDANIVVEKTAEKVKKTAVNVKKSAGKVVKKAGRPKKTV